MRALLPKPVLADGDAGWQGVNMRVHASDLPAGWASSAINMRFTDGKPETRRGKCPLTWMNKITGGVLGPWGTVYGPPKAFLDPVSGQRLLLIAADGNVYYCRSNNPAQQIALPGGATVTGDCEFLQAFDVVLLGRGQATAALVMKKLADGFTAVPAATVAGALSLPNFLRGLNASNRVFVISGRDNVIASDLLDYVTYSLKQDFRINQGEADQAVALAMFGDSTLITLKETRVYKTTGVTGDLSGIATKLVTSRYGCVAPRTVVVGDDLYWLSQEGIASLTLTEFNEVQASVTGNRNPGQNVRMFSEDIQPLIERINWSYAGNAVGIYHQKRIYFALPVDDAVTFGPELMGSGLSYNPSGGPGIVIRLENGKRYRWVPGAEVTTATADTDQGFVTLSGQTEFVAYNAAAPFVTVLASGTVCASRLQEVKRGVNNAVAVYNTVNRAWEGYDITDGPEGRDVKFFFTFPYGGKERLFFVGSEGWINLFEETGEDVLSRPYVDIEVTSLPAVGNSVQVNGGTVVAARNSATNGGGPPLQWGCDTLAHARTNLYYPYAGGVQWTRPDTAVTPITNGVRLYGTNGVVPTVVVTGTWATLTYRTRQGIETDFLTRGYGTQQPLATKQGRELAVFGETWAPSVSLSVVSEGVGKETTFVNGQTRDRTKFDRPWDAAPYDVSNPSDNYLQADRQDYSFAFGSAASQINLGSGVNFDQMQSLKRKVHAPARAVAPQVRVRNGAGRIKILAIGEKGFEVEAGRKGTAI